MHQNPSKGEGLWSRRARIFFRQGSVGFILPLVLIISVLLSLLFVGLLEQWRADSRMGVKVREISKASTAAEEGLAQAYYQLNFRSDFLRQAQIGQAIAGFAGDVVYTVHSGSYKIEITSGPSLGQVTVLSKGMDRMGRSTKGIRAIYWQSMSGAYLSYWGFGSLSNDLQVPRVHWSPIRGGFNGFTAGMLARRFPRYFSDTSISGTDTDPTSPNTDGLFYWAYDERGKSLSTSGKFPIDMEYYIGRAQSSNVPVTVAGGRILANECTELPAVASPPGSGYFEPSYAGPGSGACRGLRFTDDDLGGAGYRLANPNAVLFLRGTEPKIFDSGTFLDVEAVLSDGDIALLGAGGGVIDAVVPAEANLEYQHPIAQNVWTAGGANSMQAAWSSAGRCCYQIHNVSIHGFVSATLSPQGTGPGVIYGIYGGNGTTSSSSQPLEIYYDPTILGNVRAKLQLECISQSAVNVSW